MCYKEDNSNLAVISSLRKINQCNWVGNTKHDSLEKCLRALNLQSSNSGLYNPVATQLKGVSGLFMVNQDGSIFYEARILKQDDNKFLIEYLSSSGFDDFENQYRKFMAA